MADNPNTIAWDGRNAAQEPQTGYKAGYDVVTTGMQNNNVGANAWISDTADNSHVNLWVTNVALDTALAGSTAQSAMTRDFYARNFQQAALNITCQAPGHVVYGRTVEFIHKAQRNAVSKGSLMNLVIPGGGLRNVQASIAHGHTQGRPGMKGVHNPISVEGYIQNVPRRHTRFDPAPTFTFSFVISRMRSGIFQDTPYTVYKLAKWSEIVDALIVGNLVKSPQTLEQQSQKQKNKEAVQGIKEAVGFLGDLLNGVIGDQPQHQAQ